jgi:hypothetical protein
MPKVPKVVVRLNSTVLVAGRRVFSVINESTTSMAFDLISQHLSIRKHL